MTRTLNGEIDCPMCEWRAGILYSYGRETDERCLTELYQNHIDMHCESFAEEMNRYLPGVATN